MLWQVLHLYYLLSRLGKLRFFLGIFQDRPEIVALVPSSELIIWHRAAASRPVFDVFPDLSSTLCDEEECRRTVLLFEYNSSLLGKPAERFCDFCCPGEQRECERRSQLLWRLSDDFRRIGFLRLRIWKPEFPKVCDLVREYVALVNDREDSGNIHKYLEESYNLVLGNLLLRKLQEVYPTEQKQFEMLSNELLQWQDFKGDTLEVDILIRHLEKKKTFIVETTTHQKSREPEDERENEKKDKKVWYEHFTKKLAQAYSIYSNYSTSLKYAYFYAHDFKDEETGKPVFNKAETNKESFFRSSSYVARFRWSREH